ncbi:GTPase, G3E family [Rubritalea squalenifaciens DSM 18772]|uniref:GTPase, G3E family n=1 Tax=Rubritalea squalenifaciens DSM 18772 TaxID=1123071 RepID=A0A1M6JH54_9BACT|nr:GTP-binding protein [Rubritalea squalenifaciens]SHJ46058.1 GTPase, G3E family [Rubritalea squalenifaciens DSM 18772]
MILPRIPEFKACQPVVFLTGFLGVGKTTLLRHLLTVLKESGTRSDVILNDYADASIDCATLEDLADNLEPLGAACACCEGMDYLLELSDKAKESDASILFVELNGTADPVPVLEAFTLLEGKLNLHPRWQVCVIDVRKFGGHRAYEDIERMQLQTASHIYLTHVDEVDSVAEVLKKVRKVNPSAPVVLRDELVAQVKQLIEKSGPRMMNSDAPAADSAKLLAHEDEKHHLTHEFTSCHILLPKEAEESAILRWLGDLPEGVIRAKALMRVRGQDDCRYLYERIGGEIPPKPYRVNFNSSVANSVILIGPDLNPDHLLQITEKYLR